MYSKEEIIEKLNESLAFSKMAVPVIYQDLIKTKEGHGELNDCDCRLLSLKKENQDKEIETFVEVRWIASGKFRYIDYNINQAWETTATTPEDEKEAVEAVAEVISKLSQFEDFTVTRLGE